jgi:hypothetical protein
LSRLGDASDVGTAARRNAVRAPVRNRLPRDPEKGANFRLGQIERSADLVQRRNPLPRS